MKRTPWLIALLLLLACVPRGQTELPRSERTVELTILHTNDTHGHIWGSSRVGSAAHRAGLIGQIRQQVAEAGGVSITLDAGDVRTGTLCSDQNVSRPDFEAMEVMGYDAMVVGNHEFDQPLELTLEQRERSEFPFLGANVVRAESGEPLFTPFVVIERGELRIAVLGLVTTETNTTSAHGGDPGIRFLSPTETARRWIPELRQRAHVVIVLSHLGQDVDQRLAQEVEGIDVIIGGHSHDVIPQPYMVGRTVIAQAGSGGRFLGRVDLTVGPEGVSLRGGELLRITPELPADPEVGAVLDRWACAETTETVTTLDQPITSEPLAGPGTSSVLSNLIADAFREIAETDLALMNQGGIRADLEAGPVTLADIHEVLPFENALVVVRVTGAQLLEIARSIRARGREGRGIIYTSGMVFVFGPGEEVRVLIDGQPVEPERELTMALSDFLADGGDGHDLLAELERIRELDGLVSSIFADYLRRHETLALDREPRTRWIEAGAPPPAEKSERVRWQPPVYYPCITAWDGHQLRRESCASW